MLSNELKTFRISLPCEDVAITKEFYQNELGFEVGRSAHNWVDINFFGNQITFAKNQKAIQEIAVYSFENQRLPIFHIGVILNEDEWQDCLKKFQSKPFFEIDSTYFLEDKIGAHHSFFIKDPNGYYLEFKTFADASDVFKP